MDPPLCETMLARSDVDAITGFYFTSLLNRNARGIKDEDIVLLPLAFAGLVVIGAMAMYELFAIVERRTTAWAHRGA